MGDGRGSQRHLVEGVLPDDFERGPGSNDVRVAVFTHRENFPVVSPRRSREAARVSRDPLAAIDLLAGPGVLTRDEAAVEQRVVIVAVYERRRVVGRSGPRRPDDEVVGRLIGFERDVARRARPDGVRRSKRVTDVARREIQQTVAVERRRNADRRHPREFPQQCARQIVRAHFVGP